jgi:hypothetical protein
MKISHCRGSETSAATLLFGNRKLQRLVFTVRLAPTPLIKHRFHPGREIWEFRGYEDSCSGLLRYDHTTTRRLNTQNNDIPV